MFSARLSGLLSVIVRTVSVVAVLFIVAGLIGFLTDSVRNTSKVQATRIPSPGETRTTTVTVDISQPSPPASIERLREREHTSAREAIDDVGDILSAPFAWIAKGSDPWVRRLLYSALGLILYGVLLQVLADFLRRGGDDMRRRDFTNREAKAAAERKKSGTYASPA
jgi:hypothetical protein